MYIKYKLQKKQVSHDGGVTWVDVVPLEQRIGESAGTYSTLEECEHDYSTDYLTIESLEDGNVISFMADNTSITRTISASTDDGATWTAYTSSTGGTQIATLNTGEKVLLKGLDSAYGYNHFTSSDEVEVYGNIMSLLYNDNFSGQTTLTESRTFYALFMGCKVISAANLILPATTLTNYCYSNMFNNCSGLTTAPQLPATTLADGCYYNMFSHCTSLTTAPSILPATTLPIWCYGYMFYVCTSLTTAPELPATTLAQYCYESMFNGCTNLNYIKCLATDISATGCTNGWVYDASSSGTFVKASSMNDWTTGTSGIPTGWTVQNA